MSKSCFVINYFIEVWLEELDIDNLLSKIRKTDVIVACCLAQDDYNYSLDYIDDRSIKKPENIS